LKERDEKSMTIQQTPTSIETKGVDDVSVNTWNIIGRKQSFTQNKENPELSMVLKVFGQSYYKPKD
jgi:hypothetical protein